MRYQITWGVLAEQMLARIWLASRNRAALTRAVAWLEKHLATRPLELGESRASSVQRVAFWAPIGIEFEIIQDDNRVVVQGVFSME